MIMFNCDSYTGVTCVDGGCPDALAEEYSDYGYAHTDCSECAYYRGCKDCYFNRAIIYKIKNGEHTAHAWYVHRFIISKCV